MYLRTNPGSAERLLGVDRRGLGLGAMDTRGWVSLCCGGLSLWLLAATLASRFQEHPPPPSITTQTVVRHCPLALRVEAKAPAEKHRCRAIPLDQLCNMVQSPCQ